MLARLTRRWEILIILCSVLWTNKATAAVPLKGHQASVTVGQATRLDWVFALANQSPAEAPADWLTDYDSAQQRYELYVPPTASPKKPLPVVLFVSAGQEPAGWNAWQ